MVLKRTGWNHRFMYCLSRSCCCVQAVCSGHNAVVSWQEGVVTEWGMVIQECLGTLGRGQVTSLSAAGQNSRIFSYRYHCRCADRPTGVMTSGSSLVVMCFCYRICTLPRVHHTWTGGRKHPFLMPGIFLKWGAKKVTQS